MDDFIQVIVILIFVLAGGLQALSKNFRESQKKKGETEKPEAPPVQNRGQMPPMRDRTAPMRKPPFQQPKTQTSPPLQRTEYTHEPEPQGEISEPLPQQQEESPLTRMLKEFLDVPEPEIVTPVPEPPKKKKIKKKKTQAKKPTPATLALPVEMPVPRPAPTRLAAIVKNAEREPLRTGIILSEILSPPRALRQYKPRQGNQF